MPFANKSSLALLICILAAGSWLRLPPEWFARNAPLHALVLLHAQPGFTGVGVDEGLYSSYTRAVMLKGVSSYPEIVRQYIAIQRQMPGSMSILPPTRFLYIFSSSLWGKIFSCDALPA